MRMARLWLPLGRAPTRPPQDERDEIVRQLRDLGVYLPGARDTDISQLREILHWQQERANKEPDRPQPTPGLTREQIICELREYRNHLRARQEGRRRVF